MTCLESYLCSNTFSGKALHICGISAYACKPYLHRLSLFSHCTLSILSILYLPMLVKFAYVYI